MKATEVLRLLKISRPTLYNYRKQGRITAHRLSNGYYDYDEDRVYALLNREVKRKTYLYARVSTPKQKRDLENQIELLKTWCFQNRFQIHGIFSDIASGISYANRDSFFHLLDEILQHRVEKVIITYKDRFSRVGFELFSHLFQQFGTDIVVISEVGSEKLDSAEIFEEIVALLHCYARKLYSKRKKLLVQELVTLENPMGSSAWRIPPHGIPGSRSFLIYPFLNRGAFFL